MTNKISFNTYKYTINDVIVGEYNAYHTEIIIDDKPLKEYLTKHELSVSTTIDQKQMAGHYEAFSGTKKYLKQAFFKISTFRQGTIFYTYQCKTCLNSDWCISFKIKIRFPFVFFTDFYHNRSPINIHEIYPYSFANKKPVYVHQQISYDYKDFPPFKFSILRFIFSIL